MMEKALSFFSSISYRSASDLGFNEKSFLLFVLKALVILVLTEKVVSFLSKIVFRSGPADPSATVTSIFVYPIKACRGISVPRAPISSTGFRWDRQWLVVNSEGRAYTQRVEAKLALVEVELPTDAFNEDWEPSDSSYLVLRAPGMDSLKVPLKRSGSVITGVSVWEWSGSALDEGTEASEWFSSYLGKPARLVRFNHSTELRPVEPDYARGYKTAFSDMYPFLVISQGSLNWLNGLLEEPIPMNRFRPNIVVDGCPPFSEDLWKAIKINKLTFYGVKLCARCKVPTIDQEKGVSGSEPTKTLLKFRSDRILDLKKKKSKVYFGQNLVCKECVSKFGKGKSLAVGDSVYALKKYPAIADVPI